MRIYLILLLRHLGVWNTSTSSGGGDSCLPVPQVKLGLGLLTNFTFTFHFHALEKEMVTHSSVLSWKIPGTGEPDGLPSMGSHRVGHDWSDLAAAAAGQVSLCQSPGAVQVSALMRNVDTFSCPPQEGAGFPSTGPTQVPRDQLKQDITTRGKQWGPYASFFPEVQICSICFWCHHFKDARIWETNFIVRGWCQRKPDYANQGGTLQLSISISSGWVWYQQQLTSQQAPGTAYLVEKAFSSAQSTHKHFAGSTESINFFPVSRMHHQSRTTAKHHILVVSFLRELEWIQKYKTLEVGSSPHRSSPHSHQMSHLCSEGTVPPNSTTWRLSARRQNAPSGKQWKEL